MKPIAAREAVELLKSMTRVLCAVGILALIFTTVNVTRFATGRDVPLPIAVLLDPMIGTALAGVLYVDARLASWGIRPPGWSTTLRWGAGTVAALMNTWQSLWPDGQIGWPRKADPAAVLLHLTPALLLIALTETIAAYRRTVTDLLDRIGHADPVEHPAPLVTAASRRSLQHADRDTAAPDDVLTPLCARGIPRPGSAATNAVGDTGHDRSDVGHDDRPTAIDPLRAAGTTNAGVWQRALALDDTARAATGKPVSIWRLRADLHIGPKRAHRLHAQLMARHADRPPPIG